MRNDPGQFQRRIVIGAVISVVGFATIGLRLADVALLRGGAHHGVAARIVTARADLVDRNGELLARDLPVKDLYARPHVFWNKAEAAHDLAAATGASEARLSASFAGSKHPYVLVARQITPAVVQRVMSLGLPGLEFEPSAKRYYPHGRITAQLLGVTDPDNNGLSGLELGLQNRLSMAAGGKPVTTSIDVRVQYILSHELAVQRKKFSARAAGGLVMNVRTGEILAMASLPNFDPNTRRLVGDDSMRDIMVQNDYELGSVFKIFSFALALEDHTVKLNEMIPIGRGYKIGRYTIHDAEKMPAELSVRDILARSSNIGTAQIALRSGGDRQKQFLEHMGLLSPIHTQFPGSPRPLYPANWGDIETATIAFGQGISVSPLRFVTSAAEIINGGRQITPTFLKTNADRRGAQLIPRNVSIEMRNLLRYVVTDGTGKSANVEGYDVGGKTGSAQVPGPDGRYLPHALTTSFFAAFPIDNPRYIVFVLMDRPHGIKATDGFALAGYTAAPLAGRIIARIAPLLGVPKVTPPTQLAEGNS